MTEVQTSFLRELEVSSVFAQDGVTVPPHTFLREDGSKKSKPRKPKSQQLGVDDVMPPRRSELEPKLIVKCKVGAKVESHPNTPPKRSLLPFYVRVVDAKHIVADGYEFDQLTCVSRDKLVAIQLPYEEAHDVFNAPVGRVDRVVSRERFNKIMTFINALRAKCIKSTTIDLKLLEEISQNPGLLNDGHNQWDSSWIFHIFFIEAETTMTLTGSAVQSYNDRDKYKQKFGLPWKNP